jgi:hypothetical protein
MRRALRRVLQAAVAVAVLSPSVGTATPLDMNLLSYVPGMPVSITADGSQMTISENEEHFNTLVWNIPAFNPVMVVPAIGASLVFDYTFFRAPDNAEIFNFLLLGPSGTGLDGFGFR